MYSCTLPVRLAHTSNVWPVVSPCCRTARPSRRARAMLRCPLCLSRRSHSLSSPLSSHPLALHRARALSLPVVPVVAPTTLAMSVPHPPRDRRGRHWPRGLTFPATVAVATTPSYTHSDLSTRMRASACCSSSRPPRAPGRGRRGSASSRCKSCASVCRKQRNRASR